MNIEQFTNGIYYLITKKNTIDESNPILYVIEHEAKKLRENDYEAFYVQFAGNDNYITNGFLLLENFKKAIGDYRDDIINRYWQENGTDEKVEALYLKIEALYYGLIPKNAYTEEIERVCNKYGENLKGFKDKKTNDRLFTDKEIGIINAIGFLKLIMVIQEQGSSVAKEMIREEVKHSFIVHLFTNNTSHTNAIEDNSGKNTMTVTTKANQVTNLLSDMYKNI